jgi:hypothetical protein
LEFTTGVVEETLRLYPPAFAISRMAQRTTSLGGYRVPRYTNMIIAVSAIQRDPHHWVDPATFNPDRFAATGSPGVGSHAHLPFGLGPRHCIGARFATLEAPNLSHHRIPLAGHRQRHGQTQTPGRARSPRPRWSAGAAPTTQPRAPAGMKRRLAPTYSGQRCAQLAGLLLNEARTSARSRRCPPWRRRVSPGTFRPWSVCTHPTSPADAGARVSSGRGRDRCQNHDRSTATADPSSDAAQPPWTGRPVAGA